MVKSFIHQAACGQCIGYDGSGHLLQLFSCSAARLRPRPMPALRNSPSSMAEPGLSRSFPEGPSCTQMKAHRCKGLSAGLGCSSHSIPGSLGSSLSSEPKAGWGAARSHGFPLLFPTWSVDLCRSGDTERGVRNHCCSCQPGAQQVQGPEALLFPAGV